MLLYFGVLSLRLHWIERGKTIGLDVGHGIYCLESNRKCLIELKYHRFE